VLRKRYGLLCQIRGLASYAAAADDDDGDALSPANGERGSIRKPAVKDRDPWWLGSAPENLQEAVAQESRKNRGSSMNALSTKRKHTQSAVRKALLLPRCLPIFRAMGMIPVCLGASAATYIF